MPVQRDSPTAFGGESLNDAVRDLRASGMRMSVAGCVLDLACEALIDAEGRPVDLRPQAYQLLRYLALNAGRLVTKEELIKAVWPNVVVTDDSLVQAIGNVRRALGDERHEVIKTVSRRGYIMVANAVMPDAPLGELARISSVMAPIAEAPEMDATGVASRPRTRRTVFITAGTLAMSIAAAGWWIARDQDAAPAPAAIGGRPSIAVLAFSDPKGSADGGLLARGVAQDLVSELARSHDLRVVSHQSSFAFAGGTTPLMEIGQRLRSRYLVDGTVSREGDSLRLVVDLLDSQDGHIVWSSVQVLDHSTLFTARDALVRRIAGSVQSRLHRTEERRALTHPPKTMDVYALTERGNEILHRYNAPAMVEARRLLEQALAIDPDYAPAWVILGIVNTVDSGLGLTGEWNKDRLPEVIAQIHRAITLEPDLPGAYAALSQAQALARDFDAALAAAQRCVELAPNDAGCLYIMGKANLELGQVEPAVQYFEQALDLNPVPPAFLWTFYATALWGVHRPDAALRATDDCLATAPHMWRCRKDRIVSLVELGRLAEAQTETSTLLAQVPTMTVKRFGMDFADSAVALRERRMADAIAAGVPNPAASQ
jgi:TolB-like protein/DNA-binding winged helix-turn-helix (wHTH) protein/tetratricopeptide (TPR) repeat protein